MKKFASWTAVAIFLSGCATGYQPLGLSGGYSEIVLAPDSFIIRFVGNTRTTSEDVLRYSLLRAAELTLHHGYKYFAVVDAKDQSSTSQVYNAYQTDDLFSASAGTVVKPGTSISVRCFQEKPQSLEAIDAKFYWNANHPK